MSLRARVSVRPAHLLGIAAFVVLAFAGIAANGGTAHAFEGPWCLSASDYRGSPNCTLRSFEDCRNLSIGNRGFCSPNPRFHAAKRPHR